MTFRVRMAAQCLSGAVTLALLSACGGGSAPRTSMPAPPASPTPTPTPTPTPVPTPTPTPTPASTFDTREYRDSDGPQQHGAITAWQAGNTGRNSVIAVIDTGIDRDSPEFAGRIHPQSRDVAGTRTFDATDDHGTNVAMIAAAARDNRGIMGIAYDAQVLALRADSPGSCASDTPQDTTLDCAFFDSDIARGIDVAVAAGATVINLSLGGEQPTRVLLDAISRAAAANVVIVVAAGNHGDGSDPKFDRTQPTPFAAAVRQAAGGNAIIVGSVDAGNNISAFSGLAGNQATFYLTARGERVCCVYENGTLFTETTTGGTFVYLFSGTSFAAPQVSGAIALLKQAFPNLTGAEMVDILLRTARDAGGTGTDNVYGRGILDIARAFQPIGTVKLGGIVTAVNLSAATGVASPVMGDALQQPMNLKSVVTDDYDRAFKYDVAQRFQTANTAPRELANAIRQDRRQVSVANDKVAMAFSIARKADNADFGDRVGELRLTPQQADEARVLAGAMIAKLGPSLRVGFSVEEGAYSLATRMDGKHRPAFLFADGADSRTGFHRKGVTAAGVRQQFGADAVSFLAERGEIISPGDYGIYPARGFSAAPLTYSLNTLRWDRDMGLLQASLGLSWLKEDDSILGSWFGGILGGGGAQTGFLDGSARWSLAPQWSLGAQARYGRTVADRVGLLSDGSQFATTAWAFDLQHSGVLARGDSLAFGVSQPLRVEAGGLGLNLPVSFDYATETAGYEIRRVSLQPTGREIIGELRWTGPLGRGWGGASVFYRHEPDHRASAPSDLGIAGNWSMKF